MLVNIASLSLQIQPSERRLTIHTHFMPNVCSIEEYYYYVHLIQALFLFSIWLGIECVPLTEPGVVTVICASRVRYVGNPFCTLSGLVLEVSCKTLVLEVHIQQQYIHARTFHYKYVTAGSDLSSVVINSSSPPFPIGEDELSVSFFDAMQDRIRTTVEIAISKCIYICQPYPQAHSQLFIVARFSHFSCAMLKKLGTRLHLCLAIAITYSLI